MNSPQPGERLLDLGGRLVGPGQPVYVVAEMSANHGRDFQQAVRLVHAAKEAGADAVKLQTYTADTITIRSGRPEFRIRGGTPWDGQTLYELYQQAHMPWDWQPKLKAVAGELGLQLFSSAFDATAVDFLEEMGVPAHKVASPELVDLPLVERMAATGKPLLMSTGMATRTEIEEAVRTARRAGAAGIALLRCTSAYPAPAEAMHLSEIPRLAEAFGAPVGLSDHTRGIAVAVAAVALGASIVEKHFTLSRDVPGLDTAFSLEPGEFREMVEAIRTAEKSIGPVDGGPGDGGPGDGGPGDGGPGDEEAAMRALRRSLYVVEDIKAGEPFTEQNVRSIRPAGGLPPKHLVAVLGRTARCDVVRGTPLCWNHLD